jgi:hypothetical protein
MPCIKKIKYFSNIHKTTQINKNESTKSTPKRRATHTATATPNEEDGINRLENNKLLILMEDF